MRKKIIILAALALILLAVGFGWRYYNQIANNYLDNLKNPGVLVVGSNLPYGVMEFFDENNKPIGFDVDVAQEIANRLKLKLEFNNYDWDVLLSKVKNGEIDLAISSITITPERQKEMLFSHSYFSGGQVIIVRSDDQDISGVSDLLNKKIAAQNDTTSYAEAKKYTAANLVYPYASYNKTASGVEIVNDLKNKKFDAIIVDYVQALTLTKDDLSLKIVGVPFTKEDYGIASKISHPALINKINLILSDMENDGTMEKINTKWIKFQF